MFRLVKFTIFIIPISYFFIGCKKDQSYDGDRYYHYYVVKQTNTNILIYRNNNLSGIYCPTNFQVGDTCGTSGYTNWEIKFILEPNLTEVDDSVKLHEDVIVDIYFENYQLLKNFSFDSGQVISKNDLIYKQTTQ